MQINSKKLLSLLILHYLQRIYLEKIKIIYIVRNINNIIYFFMLSKLFARDKIYILINILILPDRNTSINLNLKLKNFNFSTY